jgi:broad specificity phosphatase PhoE
VAGWIVQRYRVRAVVSSPFTRARETADIIGGALGAPVTIEPALRERSYGAFAGESYDTPRPGYDPDAYWTWQPPGGETLEEVLDRAGQALDRVARAAGVDDLLVVSHGAVMLVLWRHVTGTWGGPQVVPNAGVLEVECRDGIYLAARRVGPDGDGPKTWRR